MIDIDWIINRFNVLDTKRLLLASITPNSSLLFLWNFWLSINVTNSGILVAIPKTIPIIISETSKI